MNQKESDQNDAHAQTQTQPAGDPGAYFLGLDSKRWEVHKFGGTSVASADCFLKAAAIVEEQLGIGVLPPSHSNPNDTPKHLAVVVSAMGGKPKVTDLLLNSVSAAADRDEIQVDALLGRVQEKHDICIDSLFPQNTHQKLKDQIKSDISDLRDILKTVSLMKWQASRISELVSGFGELWSSQILASLLSAQAQKRHSTGTSSPDKLTHYFTYVDARRIITIDEDAIQDGAVCWDISQAKVNEVYAQECARLLPKEEDCFKHCLHMVITGYVASNTQGVATTLQRDGSDYSAAIMGRLLQSNNITIWTDVDGVLSADPRRVLEAHVIPEVSYNEAMELAYFGAKVIHPKTMQPAIMAHPQIPIYIRNTFNSSFHGTRIYTSSTTHTDRDKCVCGFSSIEKVALINVEGSGMMGVQGIARRLFGTLESIGINVILISQASSEHSITFATTANQAPKAIECLEDEFKRELSLKRISSIDVQMPCAIIAAVGDGMSNTSGVAGRFFSALGDAKINILAISQGCSERNISAVVFENESTRALRVIHAAFRLSHTVVRVGIVGVNDIGESLLKLLEGQRNKLRQTFELDLQVCAVAPDGRSSDLVITKSPVTFGVAAGSVTSAAYHKAMKSDPSKHSVSFISELDNRDVANMVQGGAPALCQHVLLEDNAHSVIFDCTAEEEVGKMHATWLSSGVNVVTANNTGLSGSQELRKAISDAESRQGKLSASYLHEVTVGGALPVLSTLRDLLNSGDKIRRVDGIFSVAMSYLMWNMSPPESVTENTNFDIAYTHGAFREELIMPTSQHPNAAEGISFSTAVAEAIALDLMEEDVVTDLSNEYTARILMVLAKELGIKIDGNVDKIQDASDKLVDSGTKVEDFKKLSADLDEQMKNRIAKANLKGCVLRHLGSVDVKTGAIEIKFVEVPHNHIFAITPPTCAIVRFFTERHMVYPLIVQGPAAGADSTASALLAELLNLMRSKIGPRNGALVRTNSSAKLA